jgi:hypothetical protein
MNMKCARTVSVTALLATALVRPAAAQSANALLRDTNRQDVGTVSLLQTPAGVCSSSRSRECLRASMPSIFMPWASASCPRSIRRVRILIRATPITASCWAPARRLAELAHSAERRAGTRTDQRGNYHRYSQAQLRLPSRRHRGSDPRRQGRLHDRSGRKRRQPDCLRRDQPRSDNGRPDTGAIARRNSVND